MAIKLHMKQQTVMLKKEEDIVNNGLLQIKKSIEALKEKKVIKRN